MGYEAWYIILIPLIGGVVWAINRKIKEKNARSQKLEQIQRRIAEKELEAQQQDGDS